MEFTIEGISKRAGNIQNAADEIVGRYHQLSSLQEAATWKSDAMALMKLLTLFHNDLLRYHAAEKVLLQQEENTRKNLSFMKRLTASKDSENRHKDNLYILDDGIKSIEVAKSSLNEIIDDVPTNKAELKAIISSLNIRKKELGIEKRFINEEMRLIRTKARQDRTRLSGISRGTMGKIASYQRASITREKESKLSPLESQKGNVEIQLIEIDKKINRLNGLIVDEPFSIETDVSRCLYCGRRVNTDGVCPGCGSDKTTHEFN